MLVALSLVSAVCLPVFAAVSKKELLELVEKKVDTKVIVALVERDCVSFEITPTEVLELSARVPAGVLEAALRCKSLSVDTKKTESTAPRTTDRINFVEQIGWSRAYPAPGQVFFMRLGDKRERVMADLKAKGVIFEGVGKNSTCERDRNTEQCTVNTNTQEWAALRGGPSNGFDESFVIAFVDDHLGGFIHFMGLDSTVDVPATYSAIRATFTDSFGKPAEQLGFWRRKFASALLPGGSIEDGCSWTKDNSVSVVALFKAKIGRAILVAVSEKPTEH